MQRWIIIVAVAAGGMPALMGCGDGEEIASRRKKLEDSPQRSAERMIRASRTTLAPVYAPLAEQLVKDLNLETKKGVGLDVGSGPGTLIVELARRSQLHWINADINPWFFPYFLRLAESRGVGHRVSAVLADAQNLPFRDDYADVIVSRGYYPFWKNQAKGFREVYRVLKPGAVAYIGRGFPPGLPVETAARIRARQGGPIRYDRDREVEKLRKIMTGLGIPEYRIHVPKPPGGAKVNYGVWVELRKTPLSR